MLLFSSPFFFFSFFLTLFLFFPFILFQCIMMVKFLGLFGKKKKQSKTKNNPPKNHSNNAKWLFCFQISQSGSSADLFTKTDSPPGNLASQNGEYHEYDSGNDTSSPPSTQTSSSRSKDSQEKRSLVHDGFGHAFSSGKPKLANSDNSSDSGNSFTSCFSQTKGTALENLSPDAQGQDRRSVIASSCCRQPNAWYVVALCLLPLASVHGELAGSFLCSGGRQVPTRPTVLPGWSPEPSKDQYCRGGR